MSSQSILNQLNGHFQPQTAAKRQPTLDVWSSLGYDRFLRPFAVEKRKATNRVMDEIYPYLGEYINRCEMPWFAIKKLQDIKISGFLIKDFGGPGFNNLEQGAVIYEMAKRDASVTSGVCAHNIIGTAVLNELGSEAQRARFIPQTINMDKLVCFGLTEPQNGSDATDMRTTAVKVEGGYILNGEKYWIGNGTVADYSIIWAKNPAEGNNIQAFVVEKGMKGHSTQKIQNKYALRAVQNAHITLKDVFVPDANKLAKATNFTEGLNAVLETSRLAIAWVACGVAAGAYEAALKYCLERKQFGRPIAKFQLIQEKLSRMLASCEMMISHCVEISKLMDAGNSTMGHTARAKANCSLQAREVCQLAREVCGGNGIILDNHVMKSLLDIEGVYTYEGTYEINSLISARELTGGLASIR